MTAELQALRAEVRRLLSGYSTRAPADCAAGLWTRMCGEIGVAGLAVPAEYGGSGATLLESCVVLEELGRTLMPAPMLGSAVLAAGALLLGGDEDARTRLLPGLAAGTRTAALCWEPCTDAGGRLTGEAHQVLDGEDADTLLVPARNGGWYEVAAAAPGVTRRPARSLDLTRRLAVVTLDGVRARRLAGGIPAARLRDLACVALSAEQVGAAARALELTVAYTGTRVQFGRPIGSFQALQHRLADAYVRVEAARAAYLAAAEALVAGAGDAAARAAVAKVYCSETLQAVAAEMVQMHGGIAITWAHDAHRYLRRAWSAAQLFGAPAGHVDRLAAALVPLSGDAAAKAF